MRLDHITPKRLAAAYPGALAPYALPDLVPVTTPFLPGGNGEWEPPDSIPNSEVKPLSADDSVGPPHAKVGHRQAPNAKPCLTSVRQGFFMPEMRIQRVYRFGRF